MSKLNIKFNDRKYKINESDITDVRSDFVTYLGTIAGNGLKLVVDGIEYSVDPTKLAGAISSLETVLGGLHSGDETETSAITWDGNTEGLLAVVLDDSSILYKVSDRTFSNEEIKCMSYSSYYLNPENEEEERVLLIDEGEDWYYLIQDGYVTDDICNLWNEIVIVRTAGAIDNISGVTYPEAGIYFVESADEFYGRYYITSLFTSTNSN